MHPTMPLTVSTSNIYGKKFLILVILLFLISLPQESHGFGFNFGDNDNSDGAESNNAPNPKLVAKKAKFKFRKIDRIVTDDTNPDSGQENSANGDDDDNAVEGERQSKEADNSRMNEQEELQFERTRKNSKTRHSSQRPRKQAKGQDDNRAWYSMIYETIFNGISQEKEKIPANGNSIIAWLKWLGEKSRHLSSEEDDSKETSQFVETFTNYLNRWPFNSLFPFGKTKNKPRMTKKQTDKAEKRTISSERSAEPMSQEHFESLLHTLPAFVLKPSNTLDIDCRRQLQIFHRQLRGNKLWPLQMLDASGKISTGILHGNINQIGDFELCTQVKTLIKVTQDVPMRIRGKYCLAHIEVHTNVPSLKIPLHLLHGRGLWNSHLGNPSNFLPRYTVANWGICVPQMCTADAVADMVMDNLKSYNATGVEFHVEVDENIDCYVHKSWKFFKLLQSDVKFSLTISLLATLCGLVFSAFLRDNWTKIIISLHVLFMKLTSLLGSPKDEVEPVEEENTSEGEPLVEETEPSVAKDVEQTEEQATQTPEGNDPPTNDTSKINLKELLLTIWQSFSPQCTLDTLLSTDSRDVQFPLFHVLKIGATFMLYICLKFLMIGHMPINNRDSLVRAFEQPLSILFRAPLIYADTLFMVSGFLAAYQLSEEMQEKKFIHVLKRFAAKLIRHLPTIYIVLAFHTWIQPELGSGPLWNNLIGQNARICEQQIWRNFFSVQNAIDMEDTCSPISLQLALEMQLYLLAPLLVWLYFTDSDAGFFVYGALQALSVAMRFSRTNQEHLSIIFFHGMNVSKFYRTANLLFASPITRATTYLLGIGAGILYRTQEGTLNIPEEVVPIGWAFAMLGIIWNFWWPAVAMRSDYIYSSADAASYAAWSPLILGLALFWLIFMFPKTENVMLKFITFSRPFYLLSRITFPMQLVMYFIVLHNTAATKDTQQFSSHDLVNVNEILSIILFGLVLAFIIDVPIQNIRRIIVTRLFIERKRGEIEEDPCSGAELSEAEETSDAHTDAVTCETPEPTESIWSSDPEEEEKKVIERRRSSAVAKKPQVEEEVEEVEEEEEEEE